MFREELEDLKNRHLGRLSIVHVLESEAQDIDLFTGRIDAAKCAALFRTWIDLPRVDHRLHLRPRADDAGDRRRAARARPRRRADQVRALRLRPARPGEDSASARPRPPPPTPPRRPSPSTAPPAASACRRRAQSLLDAALEANIDAPYACKAGVCSTCRAKVLEGEAEMAVNHALEDYEVRQGYVLTCQCFPLSDKVVVSYDQ